MVKSWWSNKWFTWKFEFVRYAKTVGPGVRSIVNLYREPLKSIFVNKWDSLISIANTGWGLAGYQHNKFNIKKRLLEPWDTGSRFGEKIKLTKKKWNNVWVLLRYHNNQFNYKNWYLDIVDFWWSTSKT